MNVRAISSSGECLLDSQKVIGSIPILLTSLIESFNYGQFFKMVVGTMELAWCLL